MGLEVIFNQPKKFAVRALVRLIIVLLGGLTLPQGRHPEELRPKHANRR